MNDSLHAEFRCEAAGQIAIDKSQKSNRTPPLLIANVQYASRPKHLKNDIKSTQLEDKKCCSKVVDHVKNINLDLIAVTSVL